MRYLIKIAYDGSKFFGFQRLNEEQSVQKIIEDALSKIAKTNVEIKGAGRTDRGVHALAQYASFDLDVNITTDGLKDALNSLVKPYVYIREVKEVDPKFHARFDTVEKKYVYKINLGEYNPIACDYVYQVPYKLDIDKMKEVSELYLGAHNFHNFVSGERDNYDCIIYSIDFNITNDIFVVCKKVELSRPCYVSVEFPLQISVDAGTEVVLGVVSLFYAELSGGDVAYVAAVLHVI